MRYRTTPAGAIAAYAPPSDGPFHCANCEYVTAASECRKPEVIAEFKALNQLARTATRAPVDPEACCNFHKKG